MRLRIVTSSQVPNRQQKSAADMQDVVQMAGRMPLAGKWAWYAHCNASKYSDTCIRLGVVTTIKEFWEYYNNIPSVGLFATSQIRCKGSKVAIYGFSFFREDTRPEWEDPVNESGGEFVLRMIGNACPSGFWASVLLSCIEGSAPIVGVRCISKVPIKVEVWYAKGDAKRTEEWLTHAIRDHKIRITSHKLHALMHSKTVNAVN